MIYMDKNSFIPWRINKNAEFEKLYQLLYPCRPFERTLTMHKDSTDHIGFAFNNGEVTALRKDSSASRNGMLTEHQLLEVDGQNVVGMKVTLLELIARTLVY